MNLGEKQLHWGKMYTSKVNIKKAECDEIIVHNMLTFNVFREGAIGFKGTNLICEGVILTGGKVILHWLSDVSSIVVHDSINNLEKIMLADGKTDIIYNY